MQGRYANNEDSSYRSRVYNGEEKSISYCQCGQRLKVRTSWTDQNPGRRYWDCECDNQRLAITNPHTMGSSFHSLSLIVISSSGISSRLGKWAAGIGPWTVGLAPWAGWAAGMGSWDTRMESWAAGMSLWSSWAAGMSVWTSWSAGMGSWATGISPWAGWAAGISPWAPWAALLCLHVMLPVCLSTNWNPELALHCESALQHALEGMDYYNGGFPATKQNPSLPPFHDYARQQQVFQRQRQRQVAIMEITGSSVVPANSQWRELSGLRLLPTFPYGGNQGARIVQRRLLVPYFRRFSPRRRRRRQSSVPACVASAVIVPVAVTPLRPA
nr:protein FAM63B-like [Ipomoea batatas]GME19889.1 protein FAM63B-like [Ipomoea batatas]